MRFPCLSPLLFGLLLGFITAAAPDTSTAAGTNKLKVLVVTGGHGFAREPFFKMFTDNPEIAFREAKQGKTSEAYDRADLLEQDVLVLYDMVQDITDAQKKQLLQLTQNYRKLLAQSIRFTAKRRTSSP